MIKFIVYWFISEIAFFTVNLDFHCNFNLRSTGIGYIGKLLKVYIIWGVQD